MEYGIIEYEENKKKYNEVKENINDGIYDYIKISEIPNQGHIVKATKFIKNHTLICKYIGEYLLTKVLLSKMLIMIKM